MLRVGHGDGVVGLVTSSDPPVARLQADCPWVSENVTRCIVGAAFWGRTTAHGSAQTAKFPSQVQLSAAVARTPSALTIADLPSADLS